MNTPTNRSIVAAALGLRPGQVLAIERIAGLQYQTKTQGIRAVKAAALTLAQAARIWGFRSKGTALYRHITSGKLAVVEQRLRGRRVTVAAMLALMDDLDNKSCGKTS